MEKIEAFSTAPWVPAALVIIFSREDVVKKASNLNSSMPIVFTDESARNNLLGIV